MVHDKNLSRENKEDSPDLRLFLAQRKLKGGESGQLYDLYLFSRLACHL
jgi:hypothetical protein